MWCQTNYQMAHKVFKNLDFVIGFLIIYPRLWIGKRCVRGAGTKPDAMNVLLTIKTGET